MSIASRINDLAVAIRTKFNAINGRLLPAGGLAGKVLKKVSNTDYDVAWADDEVGGGGAGTGDVVGPLTAVNNAVVRFDGTTGELIQNSGVLISDAGEVILPMLVTPVAPPADSLSLFTQKLAGRMRARIMGPSGLDMTLQSHIGRNRVAMAQGIGGSNTITAFGIAISTTGTLTAVAPAQTNRATRMKRTEYLVTTAATGAVAGFRGSAAQYTIGDAAQADHGGFDFLCDWANATGGATATNRAFVGMASTTAAPSDVEPSSITNIIGMGWDAVDANIQLMHRGAGAVTKIDLGAAFPVPLTDRSAAYRLEMWSPSGGTQAVHYRITNLVSNAVAEGSVTANLPTSATYLAPRGWMSVGGTSSVIGIALGNLYLETDN